MTRKRTLSQPELQPLCLRVSKITDKSLVLASQSPLSPPLARKHDFGKPLHRVLERIRFLRRRHGANQGPFLRTEPAQLAEVTPAFSLAARDINGFDLLAADRR